MPHPNLPLTPSSTEIRGKDDVSHIACLQLAFELPPPAIAQADPSEVAPSLSPLPSSTSHKNSIGLMATYTYPVQPAEAVKSRKRVPPSTSQLYTTTATAKSAFALPPPPTLTRKIIQMKPKPRSQSSSRQAKALSRAASKDTSTDLESVVTPIEAAAACTSSGATPGGTCGAAVELTSASAAPQPKKKQPAVANAAAGRKQARKTAHSLIERRRRSKMNEEFAVLKGMIPACTGEMHKLAILQASIEYVRYLENCVSQLKAQHEANTGAFPAPLPPLEAFDLPPQRCHEDEDEDDNDDNDNDNDNEASTSTGSVVHFSTGPVNDIDMADSYSSTASTSTTDYQRGSYVSSATSPSFEPQQYPTTPSCTGLPGLALTGLAMPTYTTLPSSATTSPALHSQHDGRDLDHEATAALLMLTNDRRGNVEMRYGSGKHQKGGSGRGMSVRDLLSS
ncbi:hypothetical protein CFIMG_000935RA [Ceratocystis fimbriata CBS 114723]|uniref:BHLH domain-containing protein n=1 Tax=Ceratocystis fimbriata CBS 114723 TaxID=1035309 RepID=A0A2C5X9M2_9PEZI|nr:hypothetical protein CFIMG_000935RA [Ceratocystis fimbriata CBS 114723]